MRIQARLLAVGLLLVISACSVDNKPGSGLMVQVDSDLATPKDLDRVHALITQSGETLLDENYAIGSEQQPPPVNIPIVFRGDTAPAHIEVVGYRLGQARVQRVAVSSIPTSRWALLRLRLNYLCLGRVADGGEEACKGDLTCVQGECAVAAFEEADLPDFSGPTEKAQTSTQAVGACFDAINCFENASEAMLRDDCSFEVNSELAGDQLNVALRLPRGSVGTCGEGACFVPFDLGPEGFSYSPGTVSLPRSLCERAKSAEGQGSMTVVFSNSCATKTADRTLCDETSQARSDGDDTGMSVLTGVPGSSVGPACDGARAKSCGMCGTQTRGCVDGTWGEYGDCGSEGECAQNQTRDCGSPGSSGQQTCGGACGWGDCLGQLCRGTATQACDRCGTQARSCDNGIWGMWGECADQRACSPGETQACGNKGTQACGGSCEWGPCGEQSCSGAPTEACGMCGSRTRECNASSGEWSEFGACSGEGACMPNETRECGRGGTQVCGGNCQWSPQCTGQTCEGERSMACGNCGTRTRTCDSSSGTWSDWSACSGQGDCSPDQTRGCGRGGTQVCDGSCRWDSECTGQSCVGAGQQSCGNCGVQTRSCDGASGSWSDWSGCRDQGECRQNSVRSCGTSGTQECGNDCRWQSACSGQMCKGETSRPCGNCGVQRRSCDASNGRLSDWGACENQGSCGSTDTRLCGSQGKQACGDDCKWQIECTGQVCAEPADRACGNCGRQTSTCDQNTGRANWSTCRGEGQCAPGDSQTCGMGGVQECGDDCRWAATCSMQVCTDPKPAAPSCERCGTREPMCDSNSGKWVIPTQCSNQRACMPGQTRSCGRNNSGTSMCGDNCEWGDCALACAPESLTRSCGNCMTGTQTGKCDPATGMPNFAGAPCVGGGECAAGMQQACSVDGRTGSRTCSMQCSWSDACVLECAEPPSTRCGNKCGVRSGDCNSATGQRACVEAPGACEPNSQQACSDERGSGTQSCGNNCMWGGCDINMPACNGTAGAACGLCGRGTLSTTCDAATHDRSCDGVPNGLCDPKTASTKCDINGRSGTRSCSTDSCTFSDCVADPIVCNGSANARCGLCGLGRTSASCDETTHERSCDNVPGGLCDPDKTGTQNCTTRDERPGTQTCSSSSCMLTECVATAPVCSGNAGERCGACNLGMTLDTCNASGVRDCGGVPGGLCNPSSGTQDCTTSDGRPGKQSCSSTSCMLTTCEATAPLCSGSAGERCGACNLGMTLDTCNASGVRDCGGVPGGLCNPSSGTQDCTTSDGRPGKQSCSSTSCMLTTCEATAPLCSGNAGERCGACNLGMTLATCNASGVRDCAGVPGGLCDPSSGTQDCMTSDGRPGRQSCSSTTCMLTECMASAPLCNGTAGGACGPCGKGSYSADCDPSTHERTCSWSDPVCDPAAGLMKTCTREGQLGGQACESTCTWSDTCVVAPVVIP